MTDEFEQKRIQSLREKYAGREVPMIEGTQLFPPKPRPGREQKEYPTFDLDYTDDSIKELFNDFGGLGSGRLRIWHPGMMGSMDQVWGRVNLHVEKEEDGKWRIQDKITLG